MMNTSKQSQHKRLDRHSVLVAMVLIAVASLVVLGNISLSGLLLVVCIFILLLFVARFAARYFAHYWGQRNHEVGFENVTGGNYERILRGLQTKANDQKTEYSALKRRIGSVKDDGERAKLFIDLTIGERRLGEFQDSLTEEFKMVRELKQGIKEVAAIKRDLAIAQDRLLRQTSFIYNARKSLEEIVVVRQKVEDDTNQVVVSRH